MKSFDTILSLYFKTHCQSRPRGSFPGVKANGTWSWPFTST